MIGIYLFKWQAHYDPDFSPVLSRATPNRMEIPPLIQILIDKLNNVVSFPMRSP
jgi:hypothetical protein